MKKRKRARLPAAGRPVHGRQASEGGRYSGKFTAANYNG